MSNRKSYPSDISENQFKRILPLLQKVSKTTKPLEVNLLDVFNAVLYVLKEGCRWRSLPHDYPNWNTVYYYFNKWNKHIDSESKLPLLEVILNKLVSEDRRDDGRAAETTMLILDAQSVKNTDPAEQKGYDGGKKVSGMKRHLAVDSRGLPHILHVTTANISDKAGAMEMIEMRSENFQGVKKVLVDGGYNGEPFAKFVQEKLVAETEVAKRSELHTFAVIPKRWVVERTISWLEKCRRLWKNCERKLETSLTMMRLAFISLILRRS
jgi:transposase